MKLTTGLTRKLGEVLVCLGVAGSLLQAQEAQAIVATARFHVVQDGRYVTVTPEDVTLLEDGAPRKFATFENGVGSTTAKPVEVTLLFDTSGGVMDMDLLDPLMLKESFLDALPGVKVAVYGFNKTLNRYTMPTSEVAALTAAVNKLRAGGAGEQVGPRLAAGTPAALLAVLKEAASTPGQASRIVVLFSDGLTTKPADASDAAALSNELGIAVYPVVLGHADLVQRLAAARQNLQSATQNEQMNQRQSAPPQNSKNNSSRPVPASNELKAARKRANQLEDFETGTKALKRLGDVTGGRAYDPTVIDPGVMKTIWQAIALETGTQYAVGFSVATSPNPKKHKMEVRLVDPQKGTVRGGKISVRY